MQRPSRTVLEWASARAAGPGASVDRAAPTRPHGPPWILRIKHGTGHGQAVLKVGAEIRAELATEAEALTLAEEHGLLAPRVIAADLGGAEAGEPALLMSFLDGSSDVPAKSSRHRLRSLGAAAAAIHSVPLGPSRHLPLRERHMPWIDLALERHRGEHPTTELLDAAYEFVAGLEPPRYETVFVHADLWSGNTMWVAGTLAGVIDWEAAGAGSPGVDLGSLRLDVALLHDPGAPDEVRRGWEAAAGRPAPDVDYWDVVAALNTPADMVGMLPTIHQAGRADLDAQSLAARRDSFLRAALTRAAA